jgi:hypothetical protein
VVDYDTHWIIHFETKLSGWFLDFHSAQYSYFDKIHDCYIQLFQQKDQEKRELYRIKEERVAYPSFSIGKYCKEYKVNPNNVLTMQGALEKVIKENVLKINSLKM